MKSARSTTIANTIREELQPQRLVPSLLVSPVHGLTEVVLAISLASLIFSGQLAMYLNIGIGLALVTSFLANVILALFVVIPGTVTGIQDVPAAIMAVIAASLVALLSQSSTPEQLLPTVLIATALITLLCGLFFTLLGQFKLGNIIRFLPYPVIGGFLAGTGWLLFTGGIDTLVGPQSQIADLFQPTVLILWLPGLVLGVALFVVTEWIDSPFAFPITLLVAVLLFGLVAWISGTTIVELRAQGWLLQPFQTEIAWQPITPAMLTQVDWQAIAVQLPRIITLIIVSTISLLLNVSGLELTTHEESDLNAELRTSGIANIVVGLAGGMVNFQQLGLSALNHRSGARSRVPGLIGALIVFLVLVAGSDFIILIPKLIMGSVLVLLGLSFLYDWLYRTWFTLPKIDYLIVVVILLVIVTVGFLEGIGLGLLFAVVMFVVNYSRTDIVRYELSGKTYHSRVTRPSPESDYLFSKGAQIHIFELQGFIFFGTADKLLHRIQTHIRDIPANLPTFVLLDFRRTPGIDSTALLSFQRLEQVVEETAVTIILTALSPTIKKQFTTSGLLAKGSHFQEMANLDTAVEWCEDQLLRDAGLLNVPPVGLSAQLAALLPDTTGIESLLQIANRLQIPAGTVLIKQGAPAYELYFIESGQVTAQLEQPGQSPVRLETMGYGQVVGELGFYSRQARTASVVADQDSVVYRLTRANLIQMETADPQAAAAFHHLIAQLLAQRVTHLIDVVNALTE